MLLIGLAAAVLALFAPQAAAAEPTLEAILAPAMTPTEVAAFCFAPANRRAGERDRDCQYRVLRDDPIRVAQVDGLRRHCERQAASSAEPVEDCVVRTILSERAAAEAARLERVAAAERAMADNEVFGDAFGFDAGPTIAPPPPPPPEPARRNCRRETTAHPDGTGGSVTWICGNDDRLSGQLREMLRPD